MSKEALAKVVQRAISDAAFRRQLSTDPAGALRGFSLSADETAAVRSGDPGRLSALGIDQRMSKAYVLGGTASRMAASDISGGSPNLITSGTDGVLGSVDQDGGNASSQALVSGDTTSDGNLIDAGVTGGGPAIVPTDPASTMRDEPDMNVLAAGDVSTGVSSGVQADAWVNAEGHETLVGYDPSQLASTNTGLGSGTYSGDDIAGPAGGLNSSGADAAPSDASSDTPNHTP
jgi:hypothetical protein